MLAWMAYVLLVGAALSLAAWLAEKACDAGKGAARWVWSLAILASLFLPLAIASVSVQAPGAADLLGRAPAAVPLRQLTSTLVAPAQWAAAASRRLPAPVDLDRILAGTWIAASALLVLGIALHAIQLHRAKKSWRAARVAGVEVLVSDGMGPALVGLLSPRIVVPAWVEAAPAETQGLIIAHERTHLDADDARLLATAVLLIVCMPWNLPLWWQLRRLRFAIEVDCDARVLRGGGEPGRYGETLLMVAERHVSGLPVVAAMSEPKSNLEKRLRKMLSKPKKFAWAAASAFSALALTVAAGAAEVSPPNRDAGPRKEIALAPAVLDTYAGAYSFYGHSVLDVTREGGELKAKLNGQPAFPIFATAKDEFFYKVVPARLSFHPGPGGKATGVTLHQAGADMDLPRIDEAAAAKIRTAFDARAKAQTAAPGTEAAIRRFLKGAEAGAIDYSLLTPEIAKAVRAQQPKLAPILKGLGKLQDVSFQGVGPNDLDVYRARYENGVMRWLIFLGPDGKIANLAGTPGP